MILGGPCTGIAYAEGLEEQQVGSVTDSTMHAAGFEGLSPSTAAATERIDAQGRSALAGIAGRAHLYALLLAVAASPFEAGYPPLTRFFRATFTNLELVLLLLSGALVFRLAADPSARRRVLRLPLALPIVALLAASVLSAVFGEYRAEGVNYIYRLCMGVVVFTSVWLCMTSGRRLLSALAVLVGAAAVSAGLGLLEFVSWFDIEPWLAAFKPMPTTVGGAVRLSGTFEYANGAAAYFEMVLPVLLGLAMLVTSRRNLTQLVGGEGSAGGWGKYLFGAAAYALCGVLMVALLLTLSRAALGGLFAGLASILGVSLLRMRSSMPGHAAPLVLRSLLIAGGVMLLGAAYLFFTQPVFKLRLTTENDRNWYTVSYSPGVLPSLSAGAWVTVPLTVQNNGPMVWRARGALAVHASYHWMSDDKTRYLVFEGARTDLPGDLAPGESARFDAVVQAPSVPGTYYLQWDMVQENVTWFSYKSGVRGELTRYDVGPAAGAAERLPAANLPPPVNVQAALNSDSASVSRKALWSAALKMFLAHPLTGVGPDGFRNLYGHYAGVTDWNRNIYTNNTYLEMFTNLGIIGGLAFLWLAGFALWTAFRNLARTSPGGAWLLGLGATGSVLAFLVHGFADYFLFSTPMYSIFWLLLGVSVMWPQVAPGAAAVERNA